MQEQIQQIYTDQQQISQPQGQLPAQSPETPNDGPRRMSFFTLVLKTFFGFISGTIGSMILLLIYLGALSILQPVVAPAEATAAEISPLFIVILMAMIFITSAASSIVGPLLLSYTERERYPRITTTLYQIFIMNIVIFLFVSPIYLTTSITRLEFTAYAAGLQIVMVAMSAALIMEIMNDQKYSILGVYTSILGVLVATAANLFIFNLFQTPTILLFAALPITWASIGFFQAALAIFYYWYYTNWGVDLLASATNLGADYGEPEAQEEELPEDKNGGDFFK